MWELLKRFDITRLCACLGPTYDNAFEHAHTGPAAVTELANIHNLLARRGMYASVVAT